MEIKPEDYEHALNEEYLNLSEAAAMLEISEEEMKNLVDQHKIPTHHIAGAFMRLKKKEIEELKIRWRIDRELFPKRERYFAHRSTVAAPSVWARLGDFWYFNDFYILCTALILALLYLILSTQ